MSLIAIQTPIEEAADTAREYLARTGILARRFYNNKVQEIISEEEITLVSNSKSIFTIWTCNITEKLGTCYVRTELKVRPFIPLFLLAATLILMLGWFRQFGYPWDAGFFMFNRPQEGESMFDRLLSVAPDLSAILVPVMFSNRLGIFLEKSENQFLTHLIGRIGDKESPIIEPVERSHLQLMLSTAFPISLMLPILLFQLGFSIIGFLFLAFALSERVPIILASYFKSPYLSWRMGIIDIASRWASPIIHIVMFLGFSYLLYNLILSWTEFSEAGAAASNSGEWSVLIHKFSRSFSWDPFSQVINSRPRSPIASIGYPFVALIPDKPKYGVRLASLLLLFWFALLSAQILRGFFRLRWIPRDWETLSARRISSQVAVPSHLSSAGRTITSKMIMGMLLSFYSVFNLVGFLVGLEVALYIMSERMKLVTPFGVILAVVPALSFTAFPTSPIDWVMGYKVAAFILFPISLPAFIIWSVWAHRFGNMLFNSTRFKDSNKAISIAPLVEKASKKLSVPRPWIVVRDNIQMPILLDTGWPWNRRAIIYLRERAISYLTEEQMYAALAHEISHIKQGLLSLRLARLISLLTLFPGNIFSIFVDLDGREFEADKLAIVEAGADKVALQSVLIWNSRREKKEEKFRRFRQRYSTITEFLFADNLTNYIHPPLSERLGKIREL